MDEIIKYEDYQDWLNSAGNYETSSDVPVSGAIPVEYRRKHIHKPGGFVETYCESRCMKG